MNYESLAEILRPTALEDLIQRQQTIDCLIRARSLPAPPNMLFYGVPGLGKTSAGLILAKAYGSNYHMFNGSLTAGIDLIRTVQRLARSPSLFPGPRIIFIDEADGVSVNGQAGLRGLIEEVSAYCRFLLTANDISKFHPALKSRCTPICFDILARDAEEVVSRLLPRLAAKIAAAGFYLSESRLREILYLHFPDVRGAVGQIELEARRIPRDPAAQ